MNKESSPQTKKHIIALSCSPSRGYNSDSMLDHFLEGVAKNTQVHAEKIYIHDIPMEEYNFNNRTGPLEHETEFKELLEKISNANGLIIATPTYNFSVPVRLKNFIDRIRPFALDFENMNKIHQPSGKLEYLRTYFLVSGGTPSWAQKILFFAFPPFWLRSVFLYYGSKCLGAFYSGDVRTVNNKKILNKCMKKGVRFASQIARGSDHSVLEHIFWRPPQKN